jgi:hypothetical protein
LIVALKSTRRFSPALFQSNLPVYSWRVRERAFGRIPATSRTPIDVRLDTKRVILPKASNPCAPDTKEPRPLSGGRGSLYLHPHDLWGLTAWLLR